MYVITKAGNKTEVINLECVLSVDAVSRYCTAVNVVVLRLTEFRARRVVTKARINLLLWFVTLEAVSQLMLANPRDVADITTNCRHVVLTRRNW